jgi:hypothetical protein
MAVTVYETSADVGLDQLEDEVARAFEILRGALLRGDAAVVSLDDARLAGVGEPAAVACEHALLGLVRALALEGRRPGWRINALASPASLDPLERLTWIERLGEPGAASGTLVRLGADHLGKVPA